MASDPKPNPAEPARTDNRTGKRHSLVLLAGRVHADGADTACLVHDISRFGLMARFTTPVAVGDRLSVEVRGLPPLAGEIRWTRDDKAGIQFDEAHDIDGVFQRTCDDGRIARSPRFHSAAAARFRAGHTSFDATLLDISLGGAKLASEAPVQRGQPGQIQLPDMAEPVFGTVCWTGDGNFGFKFATTLPIAVLAATLSRGG